MNRRALSFRLRIASAVLLLGALLVAGPLLWQQQQQRSVAASSAPIIINPVELKPAAMSGKPITISVPSRGIDILVSDGAYDANTANWTLNEQSAFYALPTAPVNNDNGNTLIYGHAIPAIFGNLPGITAGAEAVVTTDNGYRFVYTFRSSRTTNPQDVSMFSYQGAPILTLQTCTGFWSQHRELFTFDFVRVEKI